MQPHPEKIVWCENKKDHSLRNCMQRTNTALLDKRVVSNKIVQLDGLELEQLYETSAWITLWLIPPPFKPPGLCLLYDLSPSLSTSSIFDSFKRRALCSCLLLRAKIVLTRDCGEWAPVEFPTQSSSWLCLALL